MEAVFEGRTIWKFPLGQPGFANSFPMPKGAEILTVQMQGGVPCIWAVVNPAELRDFWETVTFQIIGTGWDFDTRHKRKYVGTVQDGPFVWHVFQLLEDNAVIDLQASQGLLPDADT